MQSEITLAESNNDENESECNRDKPCGECETCYDYFVYANC